MLRQKKEKAALSKKLEKQAEKQYTLVQFEPGMSFSTNFRKWLQ